MTGNIPGGENFGLGSPRDLLGKGEKRSFDFPALTFLGPPSSSTQTAHQNSRLRAHYQGSAAAKAGLLAP